MAKMTREAPQESVQEVEVFNVELSPDEKSAFLAAPDEFAKSFLEGEGHKVNRVVIDRCFYRDDGDGDDFPCPEPMVLVHAILGHLRSHWVWICKHPI
ncbi:hypothetical protein [Streptomyces sp. NPDC046862]|uniref:hypothetical protein n=1 Tax=Streptomyces sp. NPDC046862 TaxID=3154603 RepID=UPI003456F39E